jgi:hypothetical protein
MVMVMVMVVVVAMVMFTCAASELHSAFATINRIDSHLRFYLIEMLFILVMVVVEIFFPL